MSSDVDCELPLAAQMMLLESSVDQINKSLFPRTLLNSRVAQCLVLFMLSVSEAISHNTVSWEVIFCFGFNWRL